MIYQSENPDAARDGAGFEDVNCCPANDIPENSTAASTVQLSLALEGNTPVGKMRTSLTPRLPKAVHHP
jgi:hypothetical protein